VHAVWPEQPFCSSLPQTIAKNPYISGGTCCVPQKYSCRVRPTKKRLNNLPSPPGTDCLKPTGEPTLLLGTAMTTNLRSLHITLRSSLVPSAFEGLVDSGSSDCFLDSVFVARNELPTREITPLPIALIDGTVNAYVNRVVLLKGANCHEPPLWLSPFLLFFSFLFYFLFIAWESLSHYVTQGVTMSHQTVTHVTSHVTRSHDSAGK